MDRVIRERVRIVGCEVMEREIMEMLHGVHYPYDLTLLGMKYHGSPARLRDTLQSIIDSSTGYRCILLLYGLCGGVTRRLVARGVPVVFPRVHDCIDLLLGSTRRRREIMSSCSGTYFMSNGWIEKDGTPAEKMADWEGFLDKGEVQAIKDLTYGGYRRGVFIRTGVEESDVLERARASALEMGWQYTETDGDLSLLKRLLCLDWDEENFVILQDRGEGSFGS